MFQCTGAGRSILFWAVKRDQEQANLIIIISFCLREFPFLSYVFSCTNTIGAANFISLSRKPHHDDPLIWYPRGWFCGPQNGNPLVEDNDSKQSKEHLLLCRVSFSLFAFLSALLAACVTVHLDLEQKSDSFVQSENFTANCSGLLLFYSNQNRPPFLSLSLSLSLSLTLLFPQKPIKRSSPFQVASKIKIIKINICFAAVFPADHCWCWQSKSVLAEHMQGHEGVKRVAAERELRRKIK